LNSSASVFMPLVVPPPPSVYIDRSLAAAALKRGPVRLSPACLRLLQVTRWSSGRHALHAAVHSEPEAASCKGGRFVCMPACDSSQCFSRLLRLCILASPQLLLHPWSACPHHPNCMMTRVAA
jgi:hypothetical protein